MKSSMIDILNQLDKGQLNVENALYEINSLTVDKMSLAKKKARKIKIIIIDGDKKIRLPGFPLWFVSSFGRFGLKIAKINLKSEYRKGEISKKDYDESVFAINNIDLRVVVVALMEAGPCTIVDIYDSEDNSAVKIDLLS